MVTFRFGLVGLMLYFAYRTIPMNPREIVCYLLHTGVFFYVSLSLFTLFLAVQASIWLQILNDPVRQLSLHKGLLIYTSSQFGKYIPGGIWNLAGRVVMASREGVPVNAQIAAIVYENVLLVVAAAVYALILLVDLHAIPVYVCFLFAALLAITYLYFPKVSEWTEAACGRLLGKFKPGALSKRLAGPLAPLSRNRFFRYLGYYLASHLIMGISFWLLLRSFHILDVSVLYASGTFAASWLLGLLSPLPGGIGVREGFLVYFLSFRMDASTALQISIIARIWNILSEVLLYVAVQTVQFTRKKRMNPYET